MKYLFNKRSTQLRTFGDKLVGLAFGEKKQVRTLSPENFVLRKTSGIYSFLSYEKDRDALLDLKRNRESRWIRAISKELYKGLVDIKERHHIDESETVLLVPIPLSRLRFLRRGFNQSRTLLRAVALLGNGKNFALETNNLVKVRETPRQATLSRRKRLTNQKDAYKVRRPELVRDKTVFVFDDISTTGATLKEAEHVLEAAGAKQVICISLAH